MGCSRATFADGVASVVVDIVVAVVDVVDVVDVEVAAAFGAVVAGAVVGVGACVAGLGCGFDVAVVATLGVTAVSWATGGVVGSG